MKGPPQPTSFNHTHLLPFAMLPLPLSTDTLLDTAITILPPLEPEIALPSSVTAPAETPLILGEYDCCAAAPDGELGVPAGETWTSEKEAGGASSDVVAASAPAAVDAAVGKKCAEPTAREGEGEAAIQEKAINVLCKKYR